MHVSIYIYNQEYFWVELQTWVFFLLFLKLYFKRLNMQCSMHSHAVGFVWTFIFFWFVAGSLSQINKIPLLRVTWPYLNLLEKPTFFVQVSGKYTILYTLKGILCFPYLKFSDLLPKTHLFLFSLTVIFAILTTQPVYSLRPISDHQWNIIFKWHFTDGMIVAGIYANWVQ